MVVNSHTLYLCDFSANFWIITACNLISDYQYFSGTCYSHFRIETPYSSARFLSIEQAQFTTKFSEVLSFTAVKNIALAVLSIIVTADVMN